MDLKCFLPKQLPTKTCIPHIIQKAVDNNLSEERTECLTCERSNYLVKFSTPHPTLPVDFMTYPPHTTTLIFMFRINTLYMILRWLAIYPVVPITIFSIFWCKRFNILHFHYCSVRFDTPWHF